MSDKTVSDKTSTAVPCSGVPAKVRIGIILATAALPLVGIIAGLTYLRVDDPEKRKVGRSWLFIGIGLLLAYWVIFFAVYLRSRLDCPPSC